MFVCSIPCCPEEMMKRVLKGSLTVILVMVFCLGAGLADAGPLMDRIEAGKTIRLGFANEIPWAYPGEGNKPLGFANAITIGVLKEMGYENIEPVVTDWGGLIPGLGLSQLPQTWRFNSCPSGGWGSKPSRFCLL